jgi:hypothetical protein
VDPINDYYGMEMWKQMLGLSANPYAPPQMQYLGQKQEQQKQQGGSNMNSQMLQSLMGGSTATGMTPNAVNSRGESFYGWGSKTGDWGAQAPLTADSGLVSGAEIPSGGGITYGASGAPTSEMAGMSGSSVGGASSLGSYASTLGYIGAAIAGQHMLSNQTSRSFDGRATKDAFGGSGATEPWLAFAYQKLGIKSPTTGEQLDADVKNGNWGDAISNVPSHAAYYFDPVRSGLSDWADQKLGDTFGPIVSTMIFPEGKIANQIGKLFGSIF